MTHIFDDEDKQKAQQTKSFKEQILADLAKAKELARQQAADEERRLQEAKVAEKQAATAKDQPSEDQASKLTNDSAVNKVLSDIDQIFTPDTDKADSDSSSASQATWLDDGIAQHLDQATLWEPLPAEDSESDLSVSQQTEAQEATEEPQPASLDKSQEIQETVEEPETSESADEVQPDQSLSQTEEVADSNDNQLVQEDGDQEEVLSPRQKRRKRAKRRNRLAGKIAKYMVIGLATLLLATGLFGYFYISNALKPVDSQSTDFVQVQVPEGSGNRYIGQILEEAGLIKNASIFNYYSKFKNYGNFQSGYYNLQKSMTLDEISQALQAGGTAEPETPILGKILIPEGYTIKQISQAITENANTEDKDDKTPFTAKDFLAKIEDEDFIASMVAKYPTLLASLPKKADVKYQLEGYLFPATYNYSEDTTVESLIDSMLAAMDANLQSYYDSIANQNMTVNEVLTLASLVEKEGSTDDDRKMIASVFYNRLNQNMPLQSNIAILYAMDKLGEKTTLAEDAAIDTAIDSPYNIYKNTGLMPGPVDSPSLSAIKATVEPDSTDYLYFVADVTTGEVYYSDNYDQHSENVEKYVNSKLEETSSEE